MIWREKSTAVDFRHVNWLPARAAHISTYAWFFLSNHKVYLFGHLTEHTLIFIGDWVHNWTRGQVGPFCSYFRFHTLSFENYPHLTSFWAFRKSIHSPEVELRTPFVRYDHFFSWINHKSSQWTEFFSKMCSVMAYVTGVTALRSLTLKLSSLQSVVSSLFRSEK